MKTISKVFVFVSILLVIVMFMNRFDYNEIEISQKNISEKLFEGEKN